MATQDTGALNWSLAAVFPPAPAYSCRQDITTFQTSLDNLDLCFPSSVCIASLQPVALAWMRDGACDGGIQA